MATQRNIDIVLGFLKAIAPAQLETIPEKISSLCLAFYFLPIFAARQLKDTEYASSQIELEVMDGHCVLLRHLLSTREQIRIFADIAKRDKTRAPAMKPMYPTPKTLVFGEDAPTLKFESGDASVFNELVHAANAVLMRNGELKDVALRKYRWITMGAIKYPSPDGHFPAHIDHCTSLVYLLSLGCAANFMVKAPGMAAKRVFKFRSGDLLCFDASTAAALLHEVVSIDPASTCPAELAEAFGVLRDHRFGVQCRVHF